MADLEFRERGRWLAAGLINTVSVSFLRECLEKIEAFCPPRAILIMGTDGDYIVAKQVIVESERITCPECRDTFPHEHII